MDVQLDPVTGEIMLDQDGMPQTEEVEIKIPAFRAVSVFDVKQTSGEPIPELEAKELLFTVEGYEDFVKAVTYVAPVPISFEDIPGDRGIRMDTLAGGEHNPFRDQGE